MKMMEHLAIPLKQSQVEAARIFWSEGNWESTEFVQLRQAFPNPCDAVSIKAIVVNVLYGTNIYAIQKTADCIERVLSRDHAIGSDLVEELVVEIHGVTQRKQYSFVSKFAHFFLDSSLPILDRYAERMLEEHLGMLRSASSKRYACFISNIETLRRIAGLKCDCKELDAYLWIAGEYCAWKKNPKVKITQALAEAFQSLSHDVGYQPVLASLLGITSEAEAVPKDEHL